VALDAADRSILLLPSVMRLATYFWLRSSLASRTMAMRQSAELA